jgi:hypothetical protein
MFLLHDTLKDKNGLICQKGYKYVATLRKDKKNFRVR